MTLEALIQTMENRIPTARELIAFVEGNGMGFRIRENRAALVVTDTKDPLAQQTAKLLSREPYRTNVLLELQQRAQPDLAPARPDVIAQPEAVPDAEPEPP